MSGKRRITVDEAQWSRLQRQAQQLKALQVNAPQLVADLQRQTQSELARVAERLGNRQRTAEQALSALSDQTQKLEHETNRRLEEQASEMQRRLAESAGQLRAETNAALTRQQQAWRSELAAEREQQRAEIARLDKQLRREARASSRAAQAWLQDAGVVHNLIRDTLPHERFAPGELAGLERRLDTARGNAEQGQSQAALAVAQEAYHDLSELRLEIELRDREWTGLHTLAYEALLRIDGLAEENAHQPVHEGEAAHDLDVDYWSEGGLSKLRSDVAELLNKVNDTATPLSTDELRDLTEVQVPGLEQQLSDIVQRAQLRLLASQLRVNVADVVAQTLDEIAGYEVEDHTYEGQDNRRAFLAKLQHSNGNEIVVSVDPATDESGQCVLRLLSYDYDTAAESELEERARAVTQELRAQGLDASDQGCESGEPDRALLDFDGVRQAPALEAAPGAAPPADAAR